MARVRDVVDVGGARRGGGIPEATVLRLPIYQRILHEWQRAGRKTISSETLGRLAGENPANVRKDLSRLGTLGTRGTGYDVSVLVAQIDREFEVDTLRPTVLVGVGNLGRALLNSSAFFAQGFFPAAIFDASPQVIGSEVDGLVVEPTADLATRCRALEARFAILCVPPAAAQSSADALIEGGVEHLLNFAPVVLAVPPTVTLRYVDLSIELQVLGFYDRERHRPTGRTSISSPGLSG